MVSCIAVRKSFFAGDGGVQLVRSGEEADLAVAKCGEVFDGGANTGAVVEDDGAGFRLAQFELGEHDGDVVKR